MEGCGTRHTTRAARLAHYRSPKPMHNLARCPLLTSAFLAAFLAIVGPAQAYPPAPHLRGPAAVDATKINANAIIPPYNPTLDPVRPPRTFGTGKVWHVGPNEPYKTFSSIAGKLGDGDVVEIDAGTYTCDQSIVWRANNITVIGVGGRPVFDSSTCALSGDKGIFNPRGTNMIIDNIEFAGAHGRSANGAGIRLDGGGYVYLTNLYFHDNQNGILMTPYAPLINSAVASSTTVAIDHSEFSHNGLGAYGRTHNIYVSHGVNTLVMRFSYSHNAHTGHEVKSRALHNYILYNRLADEATGDASYELDLPQGGLSYVIGNVIQKGVHASNGSNMTFSVESPRAPTNPIQEIYIANNTIVNDAQNAHSRRALFIKDNGLTKALMVNNLIVGIPRAQVVGGTGSSKVQSVNNIVTDAPGFYDQAHRIYQLTSRSPAVNAGVNPGTSPEGFSLVPHFQFVFPHGGQARPTVGALDVGAYEYVPGQTVIPAPTLTFNSGKNPIDFNAGATLKWSTTNASYCTASGGWSGPKATSGVFTTSPLTTNQSYALYCTGPDGTVSASLTVSVRDSTQARALGTYTWKDIPNSKLASLCTDPDCAYKGVMATGVYVPDTNTWYLIGGAQDRYWNTQVYGFDLSTMKSVQVTQPANLTKAKEFVSGSSRPPYKLAPCNRALHMADGSVVMANNGIDGQASWDPVTKKIVIGPWGYQRQSGCTRNGGYFTDQWTFNPFTKQWKQVAGPDPAFQTTNTASWFLDPATGIAYIGTNGRAINPVGAYLLDYRTTPPTKAIVDNTWPYSKKGPIAVDTEHHYALQLILQNTSDSPQVGVFNLNGFSMTKYGTNGVAGTTKVVGGPGPELDPDTSWKVEGDPSVLKYNASITYNPKLDLFVAWAGKDKVYFIKLDYANKTADFISKRIPGGPTYALRSWAGMSGYMTYIPKINAYLVYSGWRHNFYLLVPPTGRMQTGNPTQMAPN